jgi:DNA-binding Xre family transcriptional regulator
MARSFAEMANDTDTLVRTRLRELRTERGLSQQEVADRAGMATSTLSRLESGARRLAIDHLQPLAGALGVEVGELLAPARARDPRVHSRPHKVDGMTMRRLSHAAPGGMSVVLMDLPAKRAAPDPRTHEGHEWLYVLHGRVRLVLGDDELILEHGEAAEFSTWTPHWIGAVDGPAQVLAIFGPQGERVHMRTRAT